VEPERCTLLAGDRQRHVIIDPRNDAERDRGGVAGAAAEPCVDRGEPGTEPAAEPPRERARPREDLRHDRPGTVALQLDREVVDLPGHHPLRVYKLAIEQLQPSGNAPPGRGLISHRRPAWLVLGEPQPDAALLERGHVAPGHDLAMRGPSSQVP